MKRLVLLFVLIQVSFAQNVPFIMDHPVYYFLDKQESLGRITGEFWSTRPYTYEQVNRMLDEISKHALDLSSSDKNSLKRFQLEFNRIIRDEGVTFPWSRATLQKLRSPGNQEIRPFFMSYKYAETSGWINWSETFRFQNNGQGTRGYYTDYLGIYGSRASLAFTTQFTMHRVTRSEHFSGLPETYKEGYLLDRDYMRWISWDYPTSSLVYTHKHFTAGIYRQPIYWGYSDFNSPILSDNTSPLSHLEWTTQMKHVRFKFIHARLTPNDPVIKDTANVRRNLSAHRVEFDITPNFEFAFSEMVIYAHRDFELGYLNPMNFLFSEEHAQGDLDNMLMALDFKWRVRPGLTSYGSWLIDELDFFKLFSGWWGNKFVFQVGATYYPYRNLPSISIEYTAARPWTYSHLYPANSFTSGGRNLGLKQGPNSMILRLYSSWLVTDRIFVQALYESVEQGIDPGSDPLNSYKPRAEQDGEDETFLFGELHANNLFIISGSYYLSPVTRILFSYESEGIIEAGLQLTW